MKAIIYSAAVTITVLACSIYSVNAQDASSILKRIEKGLHLRPVTSLPMSQTVNEVMEAYQDE